MEPYELAKEVQDYLPDDKSLQRLLDECTVSVKVTSEPNGASVYIKPYNRPEGEWTYLGETPLDSVELPKGYFRWKMEKTGFESVYAMESSYNIQGSSTIRKDNFIVPIHFHRQLDKIGNIPKGMVRVSGGPSTIGEIPPFMIDKFEVTNKEYKSFIDKGGYENIEYWNEAIMIGDAELTHEEAIRLFIDRTGQSGPSTWEAGDYPDGEDNYPVRGISWYEACAYAEYAGKSIPTVYHWGIARGDNSIVIKVPQFGGFALIVPYSNFGSVGPAPVGSHTGITTFGAYDMAGNVREWCYNESSHGKQSLRGGAWNNNTYSFLNPIQSDPFDRSETNGFRCVLYEDIGEIPESAFTKDMTPRPAGDVNTDIRPVSDEVYEFFVSNFEYEPYELDADVLWSNEEKDDWIQEKVMFDASYGDERMGGYLFLPTRSQPPYQAVVYVPGSAAFFQDDVGDMSVYYEFPLFLDFVVKTGRAVFFPIYFSTFDRKSNRPQGLQEKDKEEVIVERWKKIVKDFRSSIDYLETRDDIDMENLAYYGMSWGGAVGPLICAVEKRIKTNILISGGIWHPTDRDEIIPLHYIPRVTQPTLMVNGEYDSVYSLEKQVKPMFEMLNLPLGEKKLVLFDSDHIPPRNEMIKEVVGWLDEQMGPVKRLKT